MSFYQSSSDRYSWEIYDWKLWVYPTPETWIASYFAMTESLYLNIFSYLWGRFCTICREDYRIRRMTFLLWKVYTACISLLSRCVMWICYHRSGTRMKTRCYQYHYSSTFYYYQYFLWSYGIPRRYPGEDCIWKMRHHKAMNSYYSLLKKWYPRGHISWKMISHYLSRKSRDQDESSWYPPDCKCSNCPWSMKVFMNLRYHHRTCTASCRTCRTTSVYTTKSRHWLST